MERLWLQNSKIVDTNILFRRSCEQCDAGGISNKWLFSVCCKTDIRTKPRDHLCNIPMNMEAKPEKAICQLFEAKLLQIVRRYNEDAHAFDMSASVFDHTLGMDSLDLAEVFSWIEHQFGDSPLDDQGPQFETWNDLVQWVVSCQKDRSAVY